MRCQPIVNSTKTCWQYQIQTFKHVWRIQRIVTNITSIIVIVAIIVVVAKDINVHTILVRFFVGESQKMVCNDVLHDIKIPHGALL